MPNIGTTVLYVLRVTIEAFVKTELQFKITKFPTPNLWCASTRGQRTVVLISPINVDFVSTIKNKNKN